VTRTAPDLPAQLYLNEALDLGNCSLRLVPNPDEVDPVAAVDGQVAEVRLACPLPEI
jgi:hypothetical protein